MIRASHFVLGRIGRLGRNAEYWLCFNSSTLIEIPEPLAAKLVYDFADQLGLHVWPKPEGVRRPRSHLRSPFRWRRRAREHPVPLGKAETRRNSPLRVTFMPFRRVRLAEK